MADDKDFEQLMLTSFVYSNNYAGMRAHLEKDKSETQAKTGALVMAIEHGKDEMFDLLMECLPATIINSTLIWAAEHGKADALRKLVKHGDPKYADNLAFYRAVSFGRAECLEILLPFTSPNVLDLWEKMFANQGMHDKSDLLRSVREKAALIRKQSDNLSRKKTSTL